MRSEYLRRLMYTGSAAAGSGLLEGGRGQRERGRGRGGEGEGGRERERRERRQLEVSRIIMHLK